MRELELLPAWYPRMRRLRARLTIQTCAAAGLLLALAAGVWSDQRAIRAEAAVLDSLRREQHRLRQEDLVLLKLARHVDAARLLATLDRTMPPGTTLTDIDCEVVKPSRWKVADVPQRIRVKLRALAPSAVDGANFVAGLSKVPFFHRVEMTDATERTAEDGVVLTDFRVAFEIDLNVPEGE